MKLRHLFSRGGLIRACRRLDGEIRQRINSRRPIEMPPIVRCETYNDYQAFMSSDTSKLAEITAREAILIRDLGASGLRGHCAICQSDVSFSVEYGNEVQISGRPPTPNWRETLICPRCHLNNRQRAALGFLMQRSKSSESLYLTEATTALFKVVSQRHRRTIGSEFLRDGTKPGQCNLLGVRHEDATQLTFASGSLRRIGSFDVLEHIPDFRRALQEFSRCLMADGILVMTAPFVLNLTETVTRALIQTDGSIKHLLAPEFHGDPIDPEGGVLCFYHFGWSLLDDLRDLGFKDVAVQLFWSERLGYLGGRQLVITAHKRA